MKIQTKLSLGSGVINSKLLGKKIPLLVGWSLTNRCNIRCKYCNIPNIREEEISREEIFKIIDQLSILGCRRINFTGGEPFLRDDLIDIVKYSKDRGIFTGVTSNGLLVKSCMGVVNHLDLLILSLDGPREIQDRYRGRKSYESVMQLLRTVPSSKLMISTVMYRQNLRFINFLLEKAKRHNVKIHFQPISKIFLSRNNIGEYVPEMNEYKKVLLNLIRKRGRYPIMNSVRGLKYFYDFPASGHMVCAAGRIFFRISASGNLFSCYRQENYDHVSLLEYNLKTAMKKLRNPKCGFCAIADGFEISDVYSLNPPSIFNAFCNI